MLPASFYTIFARNVYQRKVGSFFLARLFV